VVFRDSLQRQLWARNDGKHSADKLKFLTRRSATSEGFLRRLVAGVHWTAGLTPAHVLKELPH